MAVVTALGTGMGIIGLLVSVRRPRPTLDAVFDALERGAPLRTVATDTAIPFWRVDYALGSRLRASLDRRVPLMRRLGPALALTRTAPDTLWAQVVLGGFVGLLLPIVCWELVSAGGLHVSIVIPVWACLVASAGGGALPFVVLWAEATRRRRTARRVVGTFLDLVVLCLAGGMGIEGALHAAARIMDDDVAVRLGRALLLARDAGETPWEALADVGRELGLDELRELAAAVGLAGSQGARIRSTLAAKASAIRQHELADAEAEANSITERLFLPGVLLLIGFLIFLGYPAVVRIMSGF